MKTLVTLILFLSCAFALAQDTDKEGKKKNEIQINDLELPNSPAFTLLDYTPNIISNAAIPKGVTVSILNTDMGVEISPYWMLSKNNKTLTKYIEEENHTVKFNPIKNLTFSGARVKNDETTNLSAGFRTNILTWHTKSERKAIIDNLRLKLIPAFNAAIDSLNPIKNPYNSVSENTEYTNYSQAIVKAISMNDLYLQTTSAIYDELEKISTIKPLLTLDIAAAYSHFYNSDTDDSGGFGKLGAWATMNQNILLQKDTDFYFSIYQYARFLRDRTLFDEESLTFGDEEHFDVGGKLELEYKKFSLGYEYIKRTNYGDNYRSVGSAKYRISETVALTCGFGKNFEMTDDMVSFLGLSWGVSTNEKVNAKVEKKE